MRRRAVRYFFELINGLRKLFCDLARLALLFDCVLERRLQMLKFKAKTCIQKPLRNNAR